MIELTKEHLERLEEFEIDTFVNEVAQEMRDLALDIGYPQTNDEFESFFYDAYLSTKEYGLTSKRDCHAFMVARYLLGSYFKKTSWLIEILKDSSNENWEKREALLCASYERLDEMGVE